MEDPKPLQDESSEAAHFVRDLGTEIETLRVALDSSGEQAADAFRAYAGVADRAGWGGVSAALALASERLAGGEPSARHTADALLDAVPALALRSHGAPRAATPLPGPARHGSRIPLPLVLVVPEPWAGLLPAGPGHTVHATRHPDEAIALTRSLRPDVVLLDAASGAQPGLVSELRKAGPSAHAIAVLGDLSHAVALKAWLRQGAHPIISDQVRPASLLGILQRAAAAALPAPAELPHQHALVLTGSVSRAAFEGAPRLGARRPHSRKVIVLCAPGKQAIWDLSLGMRDVDVRCTHTPEGALALAYDSWPDTLLVVGAVAEGLPALFDTLFQDLLLSDTRVVHLTDATRYESAAPGDPIFDELLRRLHAQLRCKLGLELALRKPSPVEGRLEGLTPASVLRLTARERPQARIEFRTEHALYRVRLADGKPQSAAVFRVPSEPLLTGQTALRQLLGLRSARLSVRSALPPETGVRALQGGLYEQLQQEGIRCRQAQAQLSQSRWSSVRRVLVDLSPMARVRLEQEPGLLAIAEQLEEGTAPPLCRLPGSPSDNRQDDPLMERALWKLCAMGIVTRVVPVGEHPGRTTMTFELTRREPSPGQPPLAGPGLSLDTKADPVALDAEAAATRAAEPQRTVATQRPQPQGRTTIPLGGAIVRSSEADSPHPRARPRPPTHPTLPLGREFLVTAPPVRPPQGPEPWLRWLVATVVGALALSAFWVYRSQAGPGRLEYALNPEASRSGQQPNDPLSVVGPELVAAGAFELDSNSGLLEVILSQPGRLFVDDNFVGEGRMQREALRPGEHELRIVSPAHGTIRRSVAIEAGARTRVSDGKLPGK